MKVQKHKQAQPQARQNAIRPWREVFADPILRLSAVLIIAFSALGIFGYWRATQQTTYVTWIVGPIVEIEQVDDNQVKLWCENHSNAVTVPQGNYSLGKVYVVEVNKKANGEYKILLVNEV
jgi:hypothetical protein